MKTFEDKDDATRPESIPDELAFEILTRLPVKSLTRFRSVSTRWNSTISHPSFSRSHLSSAATTTTTTTTVLITLLNPFTSQRLLFSTTIPPNATRSDPNPTHVLTIPGFAHPFVSQSLLGLVCFNLGAMCVCNPSTRKLVKLPWTRPENPSRSPAYAHHRANSFGFDPVSNAHKVLDVWSLCHGDEIATENRVFTVGPGENNWRRIADGPPHLPFNESLCVKGRIYYRGFTSMVDSEIPVLVVFDVNREQFRLIPMQDDPVLLSEDSVLIEFDGNLAIVDAQAVGNGDDKVMTMWVLVDEENGKWVKKGVEIPAIWGEMRGGRSLSYSGSMFSGEMIFAERRIMQPFCVFLYDIKKNEVRKVEICGLGDYSNVLMNVMKVNEHVESILSLT